MTTQQQQFQTRNTLVNPFCLPPLSAQEHSRLTFQHHALRLGLEKNYLAPVGHPTTILDVACGCGTWTADMGKRFPKAKIVGLDLRMPICPQFSRFQFTQGSTPSVLPFSEAQFDYVHQRCLGTVLPTVHWPLVINELVRVARPGGWIEVMEYGWYADAGPATQEFSLWWQQVLARRGIDLKPMGQLGQLLERSGLTHVEQKTVPIPLCDGRAGDAMRTNLLAMIGSFKTSIIALGIDQKTFDQVVGGLPKEWQEYKTTYQFHIAYGQRESQRTLLSTARATSAKPPLNVRNSQLSNVRLVQEQETCPV